MNTNIHHHDGHSWTFPAETIGTATASDYSGIAFFCGYCGSAWAHKWFSDAKTPRPFYWNIVVQPCEKCGGGSVFENLFSLDAFLRLGKEVPHDLLLREFLVATQRKEQPECNTSRSSTPSTTSESLPSTGNAAS